MYFNSNTRENDSLYFQIFSHRFGYLITFANRPPPDGRYKRCRITENHKYIRYMGQTDTWDRQT